MQVTALIHEIDDALAHSPSGRRSAMVERLADLFIFGAAEFSGEQIGLFDDIFTRLVETIETSSRAALAGRLAASAFAPVVVSRTLAFDDALDVAGPMLEFCQSLDSRTLVQAARIKGQDHLLCISRRNSLEAAVTDVLVDRGDRPVVLSVARNAGARLSDFGFKTLVGRTEGDDELALSVGARHELPRHYFLKLLTQASDQVRAKLEVADPLNSDTIRSAVAGAANRVQAQSAGARDYAPARASVGALHAEGKLGESELTGFAENGKFEETAVALALLCGLPIESVELAMVGDRPETVLILAKAVGLTWPTAKSLLTLRQGGQRLSAHEIEQCLGTFSRLKPATARQVLQFHRRRAAGGDTALPTTAAG